MSGRQRFLFVVVVVAGMLGGAMVMIRMRASRMIERTFSTIEKARSESMGPGEWLPAFIPSNATNIVQGDERDFDAVHGVFLLNSSDAQSFVQQLGVLGDDCKLGLPREVVSAFPFAGRSITCSQLHSDGFSVYMMPQRHSGMAFEKEWATVVAVNERNHLVVYWSDYSAP